MAVKRRLHSMRAGFIGDCAAAVHWLTNPPANQRATRNWHLVVHAESRNQTGEENIQ